MTVSILEGKYKPNTRGEIRSLEARTSNSRFKSYGMIESCLIDYFLTTPRKVRSELMNFLPSKVKNMITSNTWLVFHSVPYQEHTSRRLEHLASLRLDLQNKDVLEVGAGIGDFTSFFVARDCRITATDARHHLVNRLRKRFKEKVTAEILDLEMDSIGISKVFDVVFCYGTLYHVSNPENVIRNLAKVTGNLFLLETCVSVNLISDTDPSTPVREISNNPSQAFSGIGSRPNRDWLYQILCANFEFVYLPLTQPRHKEFPTDWNNVDDNELQRAIFICSRTEMVNENLTLNFTHSHASQY